MKWRECARGNHWELCADDDTFVGDMKFVEIPTSLREARIIFAAEELLAAAVAGLDLLEHYGECDQVSALRAAIAKAEGK